MVGAWGLRKEKAPVEVFLTKGAGLLMSEQVKRRETNVTNQVTAAS